MWLDLLRWMSKRMVPARDSARGGQTAPAQGFGVLDALPMTPRQP
ncbi:MAG: hypothetical protein JWP47_2304 [Polaromonas sp.]|jgi:hypothetical protein|nr:hypothetical protein [Polaromonas sp.]